MKDEPAVAGKLLTIEEVGDILDGESDSSCSNMRDDRKIVNPHKLLSSESPVSR